MSRRMDWNRALLLAAGLAACGGDDDASADCDSFAACGGDPVGEWSFEDLCIELDLVVPGCPGATVDYDDVSLTGTLALDGDGTFSIETTGSASVAIVFPTSCLPEGTSCEDTSEEGSSCSSSGSSCRCELESEETTSSESGTWEVTGTTLVLLNQETESDTFDFCVEGDELTLHFENTDEEAGGSSTYVLSRT